MKGIEMPRAMNMIVSTPFIQAEIYRHFRLMINLGAAQWSTSLQTQKIDDTTQFSDCKQTHAQSYFAHALTPKYTWKITIKNLNNNGRVCFGIFDKNGVTNFSDQDNQSHKREGICVCTDNTSFNPIGSVNKYKDLPSDNDLIDKSFTLTFLGSQLNIDDSQEQLISFYLKPGYNFYPWFEIKNDANVIVTDPQYSDQINQIPEANPSQPQNWQWQSVNNALQIKGVEIESQDKSGFAFIQENIGYTTQWNFQIDKLSQSGPVCFGLLNQDLLDQQSNENLDLNQAVSFCTNGDISNAYGDTEVIKQLKSGNQAAGQKYQLKYSFGKLIIKDQEKNKVEFKLDEKLNFIPFIEMQKGSILKLIDKEEINKCPILYDECNFQGNPTQICQNVPEWQCGDIKSIFVPEGKKITLFNIQQYQGQKVTFSKSVNCLPEISYQQFSQNGIHLHKIMKKQSLSKSFAKPETLK